jgi:hypothetical protein
MKTLLRRAAATGLPMLNLAKYLLTFSTTDRLERVHPLQGGILRLKHPSERRSGLPRESAWLFWPRFVWQTFYNHAVLAKVAGYLLAWKLIIAASPNALTYMDKALTPVDDDDDASLDLMTKTTGVREALNHQKKVAELTRAAHA